MRTWCPIKDYAHGRHANATYGRRLWRKQITETAVSLYVSVCFGKRTYHTCAASTHWFALSWSPSAVSADEASEVSGLLIIIAAVSAHFARMPAGHMKGWKEGGKLAVMGVIAAVGTGIALSCARLVKGLGGMSSDTTM